MGQENEQTYLLWVDLETTGTNEKHDYILEVGWILTDDDLNVVDPGGGTVVRPKNENWRSMMPPFVAEMHESNGLIAEIPGGVPLIEPEAAIVNALPLGSDSKIVLSGSGVGHFDLRFINAQMPFLARHLSYYVYDIGTVRRFIRDIAKIDIDASISEVRDINHRAYDDVTNHLEEARIIKYILTEIR